MGLISLVFAPPCGVDLYSGRGALMIPTDKEHTGNCQQFLENKIRDSNKPVVEVSCVLVYFVYIDNETG